MTGQPCRPLRQNWALPPRYKLVTVSLLASQLSAAETYQTEGGNELRCIGRLLDQSASPHVTASNDAADCRDASAGDAEIATDRVERFAEVIDVRLGVRGHLVSADGPDVPPTPRRQSTSWSGAGCLGLGMGHFRIAAVSRGQSWPAPRNCPPCNESL